MENAAEALKMVGGVLLFVIGLSVFMGTYSSVRVAADDALDILDRETTYILTNAYYDTADLEGLNLGRRVGLESVIPTITRVYNETYKINFIFKDGSQNEPIFTYKRTAGATPVKYQSLDSADGIIAGGKEGKETFIKAILYNIKDADFEKWYGNKVTIQSANGLYDRLKGKDIIEYSGIYVMGEEENPDPSADPDEENPVPEANQSKKRVITYVVS